LLAPVHPRDIAQSHDLRGRAGSVLDDDLLELARVGKPAEGVDRELEGLSVRHWRSAELAGHDLDVLALDGGQDIAGRDPEGLEPARIQPDPHAVRTGPEDSHLADS